MPHGPSTPESRAKGQATNKELSNASRMAQALEVQAKIMTQIRDPEITRTELAHLARALDVWEDRIRELRGKPKAGFMRPEKKSGSRAKLHVVPMSESGTNSGTNTAKSA